VDAAELGEAVWDRLGKLPGMLGAELTGPLEQLLSAHGFTHAGALRHPLGHPLVELPGWVDEATGSTLGAATMTDLAEASVLGYLHVRVEDDLFDHDRQVGEPGLAMLLSDAFLIRHQTLLALQVGSSPRFWSRFQRLAFDYGEAMAQEHLLLKRSSVYREEHFELVLRRSMPLAIPGLAVLDLTDRYDLEPELLGLVHEIVSAGQLLDDLRDAGVDFDAGNFTWVVRRLGGEEGREAMMSTLVRKGGFDDIVAVAISDVDAGVRRAEKLGTPSAAAWLTARREAVLEYQRSFFASLLK